jgi:hypothetical protein
LIAIGPTHPPGLCILAMLKASVPELTRPIYSSIFLGLLPAACTTEGFAILIMISSLPCNSGGPDTYQTFMPHNLRPLLKSHFGNSSNKYGGHPESGNFFYQSVDFLHIAADIAFSFQARCRPSGNPSVSIVLRGVVDKVDGKLASDHQLLDKGIFGVLRHIPCLDNPKGHIQRRNLTEMQIRPHAGYVIGLGLVAVFDVILQMIVDESTL